jgi:hypothetical protein
MIILLGSLEIKRRTAEIHAQWLKSGGQNPPDIDQHDDAAIEAWFDDACYAQLIREDWDSGD